MGIFLTVLPLAVGGAAAVLTMDASTVRSRSRRSRRPHGCSRPSGPCFIC